MELAIMLGRDEYVSSWWTPAGSYPTPADAKESTSDVLPLDEYDYIIVSFSGGKDSTCCVLHLLDLGVPRENIELWHQAIDGGPQDPRFFDWPVTEAYCKAFAQALGLKILFQWKQGGFRGEMLRDNALTKPTTFELEDGALVTSKTLDRPEFYNTRLKFPMPHGTDLQKRWCSSTLKIDVAAKVFTNDPRFTGTKTRPVRAVILTGERREEGGSWAVVEERQKKRAIGEKAAEPKGRAYYAFVDRHRATSTERRIDQWHAILNWTEEVWAAIERYRIRPHPAYLLGWSRLSCMSCIFGNPDQWASVCDIAPDLCQEIDRLEHYFGSIPRYDKAGKRVPFAGTIRTREMTKEEKRAAGIKGKHAVPEYVLDVAAAGQSYLRPGDESLIELAMGEVYDARQIILPASERWVLPRGAFKHSGGPL